MEPRALLYEGKAKQVWSTDDPGLVVLRFKDDATAFNGVKRAQIDGKGALNARISASLFREVVEPAGIATHLVRPLSDTDHLCRRVEIVPVEVVVRTVVAGSFAKRYGIAEGTPLDRPIVEWFYKSDALDDPLMGDDVPVLLGWARAWELAFMREAALTLTAALGRFWGGYGIDLIDIKYEFGRSDGRLLLADEVTPDGCRLWERGTRRRFDKDVFRRELADLGDTYRALHERVFGAAT
jgi:phosphoribosylaminoimidazole-succinocarboxamide synthase